MISPLASIAPEAKIGKNVTIHPFAYIEKDVEIGDNCEIMSFASVLNGTRMGCRNRVFQSAVLGAEPQDFSYKKGEPSSLIIGDGNDIRENVVIARGVCADGATRIGNENSIMERTHICHDTAIGNQCVIGIGSTIAGECVLEDHVIISGLVILYQHVRIGQWSLIQGGCRISKDVPPYLIMNGNPAEYHGVNASLLTREGFSERVQRHIIATYRLIYQGNTSIQDALLRIPDQVPMSEEIQNIIDFITASTRGIVK